MHNREAQVMRSAGFASYIKCSSVFYVINLCRKRSPGPFPLSLKAFQIEKRVSSSQVQCPQWFQEAFYKGDLLSALYIFLSSLPILHTWGKADVICFLKPSIPIKITNNHFDQRLTISFRIFSLPCIYLQIWSYPTAHLFCLPKMVLLLKTDFLV